MQSDPAISAGPTPEVEASDVALSSEAPSTPRARTLALRFGVVVGLVLLDLWSKAAVFEWLTHSDELRLDECGRGHFRYHVFGEDVGWFTFMLSRNRGAAFGHFSDWPWLLVVGRILAAGFLIWLVARTPASRKWFSTALVLVLAGALGNLYDNLFLPRMEGDSFGRVRDFIDVYFGFAKEHFPTFNVADSCISVGAVLLLVTGFARPRGERTPDAPAAA